MGVLVRRMDLGVGGAEAPSSHGLERQLPGRPRLDDGLLDRPRIDPGIDQGAERHVAGDPAETVEIADAHACHSLL